MDKGLFLVISGPSGVGKGTVCKRVVKCNEKLLHSISMTTRLPRKGEKEGVDYNFVKEEEFLRLIDSGAFMEWARVYGNYYGTPAHQVEDILGKGFDVLLEIDVQGAKQIRSKYDDGIFVFLVPPSMEELLRRIKERAADSSYNIAKRYSAAHNELQEVWEYDYFVINDDVSSAVKRIEAIILAEKCRVNKNNKLLFNILEKGDCGDTSVNG